MAHSYTQLHIKNKNYGTSGRKFFQLVKPIIQYHGVTRILDYGCGKGALGQKIKNELNIDVLQYDPYIEAYSSRPPDNSFDLILCTDVLEHIEEGILDDVIRDIKRCGTKCYFSISTTFADQLMDNGDNAHCTIHPAEWWQTRLEQHFDEVTPVPSLYTRSVCSFVTWAVDSTENKILKSVSTKMAWRYTTKKYWDRVRALTAIQIRNITRTFVRERDLFNKLEGQSVSLVGNSVMLAQGTAGRHIDDNDIVIRLNRAPIISRESHGSRTDWVATSTGDSSPSAYRKRNCQMVLWMTHKRRKMPPRLLKWRNLFLNPKKRHTRLLKQIGRRPSTGLMVIDLLARSPCAKIELYGFDFFEQPSLSSQQTRDRTPHDFLGERQYVLNLIDQDKRFVLCNTP